MYFLGSADWMERNLDTRIEVMVPMYNNDIQQELELFLQAHWQDTASSFSLLEDSFNQRLGSGDPDERRAQRDLYHLYAQKCKGDL